MGSGSVAEEINRRSENNQENRTGDFLGVVVGWVSFVKSNHSPMILTAEDIGAIQDAVGVELEPRFIQIGQRFTQIEDQISDLQHDCNKRFTAIELRLDAIEYNIRQIGVFVPFQNAFLTPPMKKNTDD